MTTILPKAFEESTQLLFGEQRYRQFRQAVDGEPPVSIRLNPFKTSDAEALLKDSERVPWCPEGRYLDHRPDFTFDPLLHAGCYYVQEASSMFLTHALRQLVHQPVMMLDLCAAPGGKTTAARAVIPEGSLLIANEPVKVRASILSENVQKQGHPDIIVTNNYPRDFRKTGLLFDAILADVPCSGEGMFRKDRDAISEWSPENVARCQQLQRSIIEDIWPCLKPGGLLIYSTCTYNRQEDEDNVSWIISQLKAEPIEIAIEDDWHITGALAPVTDNGTRLPVCRFIPGFTRGEGLFMTALRKPASGDSGLSPIESHKNKTSRKRGSQQSAQQTVFPQQWLAKDDLRQCQAVTVNDRLMAIPSSWKDTYDKVAKALHVIHAGINMGTRKGRDLIPTASLAHSIRLNPEAFPKVDVGWKEAISFLRRESLTLPDGTPRGFVLIAYKGHPLGFCKNLGNRANNLYPQEWRIKSGHIPEQPVSVIDEDNCDNR